MVDLHIHSTFSDGTDNLDDLIDKLSKNNITVFSITDHDTDASIIAMRGKEKLLREKGLTYIKGIEFDCFNQYSNKIHIIGYDVNENNSDLLRCIEFARKKRVQKFNKRIELLKEKGIYIGESSVQKLLSKNSVGRPHIGQELVNMGLAKDVPEAFRKFLMETIPEEKIPTQVAIDAILNAGGKPVWAHPLGGEDGTNLTTETFKKTFLELREQGICGLECYYSLYSSAKINSLKTIAESHNMYVSGGSDYHGTNKHVLLGELGQDGITCEPKDLTILSAINNKVY